MTVAPAACVGGGTWRRGSKILSWIKSGPGGHTVGSRPTAGIYTVGLVEATLRLLLLLLLPPHAVLQGVYQPKREMISKLETHSFLWLKCFLIELIFRRFQPQKVAVNLIG